MLGERIGRVGDTCGEGRDWERGAGIVMGKTLFCVFVGDRGVFRRVSTMDGFVSMGVGGVRKIPGEAWERADMEGSAESTSGDGARGGSSVRSTVDSDVLGRLRDDDDALVGGTRKRLLLEGSPGDSLQSVVPFEGEGLFVEF